jgi:hypothetical protein
LGGEGADEPSEGSRAQRRKKPIPLGFFQAQKKPLRKPLELLHKGLLGFFWHARAYRFTFAEWQPHFSSSHSAKGEKDGGGFYPFTAFSQAVRLSILGLSRETVGNSLSIVKPCRSALSRCGRALQ